MALKISGTNVVNNDRSFSLGSATPVIPVTGQIRYTGADGFQVYNGTAWVAIANKNPAPTPLYTWGRNNQAQLGSDNLTSRSSPATIVGGFSDWVQLSSKAGMNAVLRANGTVWTWGRNFQGSLGDGTNSYRSSPVSVVGGFTDVIQVDCGLGAALLRANGQIWTWGYDGRGMGGHNTNNAATSSPVSLTGGLQIFTQVSTQGLNMGAVTTTGLIYTWGYGVQGRLGDNQNTNRSSPVQIAGGFTDWTQVAFGSGSAWAIRANGTAWSWGSNSNGKLGDGTNVTRSSPVSVVGGFTDWTHIGGGYNNHPGIRANGTLWMAGRNDYGLNGNNRAFGNTSSPTSVVGGFTDWVACEVGRSFTLAVRANGTAWSWGYGGQGQLGNNQTATAFSSPVSIVGGFTDWAQIAAGSYFGSGLRSV